MRKQRAKTREKGETGGMTRWGHRRTGFEEEVHTERTRRRKMLKRTVVPECLRQALVTKYNMEFLPVLIAFYESFILNG